MLSAAPRGKQMVVQKVVMRVAETAASWVAHSAEY